MGVGTLGVSGEVSAIGAGAVGGLVVIGYGARDSIVEQVDKLGRFDLHTDWRMESLVIRGGDSWYDARYHFARTASDRVRVVLVPRRWTIAGGIYDGIEIGVDLEEAFARPCVSPAPECDSFFPRQWLEGPRIWKRFPATVAVDTGLSDVFVPLSLRDQASQSMELVNATTGVELLSMARDVSRGTDVRVLAQPQISLRTDSTIVGYRGFTTTWATHEGEITKAVIRIRRVVDLGSQLVTTHEALHAIGFGHTCAWGSVMGGVGCAPQSQPTETDAAYVQLALAYYRQAEILRPTISGWQSAMDEIQ